MMPLDDWRFPTAAHALPILVPPILEALKGLQLDTSSVEWACGRLITLCQEASKPSASAQVDLELRPLSASESAVLSGLRSLGLQVDEEQFLTGWLQIVRALDEQRHWRERLATPTMHVVGLPRQTREPPSSEDVRSVEEVRLETEFEHQSWIPATDQPEAPYLVLDELSAVLEVGGRVLEVDSDRGAPGFRCLLSVRQALQLRWDLDFLEEMLWDVGYQRGDLGARVDQLAEEFYSQEARD